MDEPACRVRRVLGYSTLYISRSTGPAMMRVALLLVGLFGPIPAQAAEPVRIGLTTILSGPFTDRGQSEQYDAQLAPDRINLAGGVVGRPVEAFYADDAGSEGAAGDCRLGRAGFR